MKKKIVLKPHHKEMIMKHNILPERKKQNGKDVQGKSSEKRK
jgi:hypothetical protein